MKAQDIMIGDWVKPKNVDSFFRVGLIDADSVWDDSDTHEWDYDEIVGIPLTPEILEKNGWEKYEDDDGFHDEDCVFIPQSDNSYGVCIDKKRTFSGKISFVHELQHALRLCGIDKEIEL